ncbi:chemotaxis-specific protein-glutamate methyltransferase CheB [Cellulomonas marina]|uniref:Protein-glutamate methylesterase/protein-glutamine glutaminase n=1 Tax=Cellulomonas marina TaxID=988821 RepID=A0A1I1ASF0_9CELL|nr:chemotaxis-specific protein-glutamate methyltransferase CheB [Cellulomonas marina]GIG30649.1 hypothetical protein Cma02nite_32490 [Cellulomonas marina]SFB39408.1 two-component system, chemotaxis family, response regulator CheB [Cellulomonas marina]
MTRIRVLVVDDSVVVRRLVTDVLAGSPEIEVVGTASNGRLAQSKVEQLAPDLVTMDVEMPDMDGIAAVKALRASGHRMPIIMFSTLTERGAVATLEALSSGATDYVTKPANVGSVQESMRQVADHLIPKIVALTAGRVGRPVAARPGGPTAPDPRGLDPRGPGRPGAGPARAGSAGAAAARPGLPAPRTASAAPGAVPAGASAGAPAGASARGPRGFALRPEPAPHPVRALLVGSSTGGPEALSRFFGALTAPPAVPVLVVQHMPPVFTKQLAARLDRGSVASVVEAADGMELLPGRIHVAAGDHHLEVRTSGVQAFAQLTDGPPVSYCRPSVDVLFRSAVKAYGGQLLAVVLTGMGADGRTGCEDVVTAGGTVVVQDEATSVVWGMPGAVATAGLAHRVVPLDDVAPTVERVLGAGATRVRAGGASWR